jgi:hypothetical protein
VTQPTAEVILERLGALDAKVSAKIDALQDDVVETKEQVKLTNGRVSKLELWQAKVEGAKAAMNWLPASATGVVAGVIVALVTKFLG